MSTKNVPSKKQILEEMCVLPEIDTDFEIARRTQFIKQTLLNANMKTLVLGISGGIDSCTCGKLAQRAVNELNAEASSDAYQFACPMANNVMKTMRKRPSTLSNPAAQLR